jgi:hypothetical protein
MKKTLEEKLRDAYRAGRTRGLHNSYFDAPLDEDEYIGSLKKSEELVEEKISFTFSFLMRKLDWEKFCDLTGTDYYAKNEGYEFKDNEIFYISESKAKEFNLI